MPIYEDKIICPLALRFSQDHIRPEFQGQATDIEAAIKAIKTKPGSGDYDIVLVPPFPAIEIIRGHLKSGGSCGDSDHWLSLDNRRLYCLQRAALAHWPLRTAVAVEALRAPTEGMRKKVNSSVDGLSVGIGHSPKQLIDRWDWHESVQGLAEKTLQGATAVAAHASVSLDDAKVCIQDLCDAPAPPSMLDLFFQNEKAGATSDSSTAEPLSPRSSNDSGLINATDASGRGSMQASGYYMPEISGAWKDDKGNTYNVTADSETWSWTCVRKSAEGSRRKFTLWYDEATDSVSFGDDWSCWADARDMRKNNNFLSWFSGRDAAKRKPRFQWSWVQSQKSAPKQNQSSKPSKKATRQ